jgi:hypothetical protein
MPAGMKLTQQQINDLIKAEHSLSAVLTDYDKAERCGADCTEVRALVQQAIAQAQAIRREFGPTF